MPQGGVNENENFLDAAKRELEEEIGFKANKINLELNNNNIDAIIDDTDENFSSKIKKMNLIGAPYQIIIGKPFVLTLSYVVIFPGLASFFFWIKGIAIIGANRAGIFLHLMPIFGAIMAMVIFDEKFMFYHILGAVFIIAGITLSNKKN